MQFEKSTMLLNSDFSNETYFLNLEFSNEIASLNLQPIKLIFSPITPVIFRL